MAEPINLNRARKAKARADKEVRAVENRAKFGRTKAETSLEQARAEMARRDIDAGKRER